MTSMWDEIDAAMLRQELEALRKQVKEQDAKIANQAKEIEELRRIVNTRPPEPPRPRGPRDDGMRPRWTLRAGGTP